MRIVVKCPIQPLAAFVGFYFVNIVWRNNHHFVSIVYCTFHPVEHAKMLKPPAVPHIFVVKLRKIEQIIKPLPLIGNVVDGEKVFCIFKKRIVSVIYLHVSRNHSCVPVV